MKNIILTFLLILSIPIYPQSNWVPLNSPGGADVTNIFKVSDLIFICGIQNGSLYRTSNSGQSWDKVWIGNNNNSNIGVRKMIFNSNKDILVSTYDRGILYSSDAGLNWQVTNNGGGEQIANTQSGIMLSSAFAKSLDSGKTWISFSVPWVTGWHHTTSMVSVVDTIFIALDDSILCTKDFGNTWIKYGNRILGSQRINQIIFMNENQIIVGADNGVYFSSDKGNTWQSRNTGLVNTSKKINNLIMQNDSIYACTSSGIYYTTDYGNQWSHFNNYNFQRDIRNLQFCGSDFLIANSSGIYKVEPTEWTNFSSGIYGMTPKSISSTSNSDLIYSSSTGLFISFDSGNNWSEIDPNIFFGPCGFISKDSVYFTESASGLFYLSTDYGENWNYTGSHLGSNLGMSFLRESNIIFASFFAQSIPPNPPFSRMGYTSDYGASWNYCNFINIIEIFSNIRTMPGDLVYCYVYDLWNNEQLGIYRTENFGISWIESNSGLPDISLNAISIDKLFNLYAFIDGEIYKLNKTNFIWEYFAEHNLNNITNVTYNKNNHFIVINNNKIFISTDGIKWYPSIEGLENVNIKIVESDSLGYFYAVDSGGRIYKTLTPHLLNKLPYAPEPSYPINNQQVTSDTVKFIWNSSDPLVTKYKFIISEDSLFSTITDTTIADTTVTLFNLNVNKKYFWKVSAYNEVGWGIESGFASFITGLTDVETEQIIPDRFTLQQNYPNPFNPSTSIQYAITSLPTGQAGTHFVTLKIYDVLGKEIATLVNEEKPAGNYEIEFPSVVTHRDASLPSGIYFYQLKAGDYVETKKMILLK